MKRDIKDFVSQEPRSKYYAVSNLSGFLDAQNANLFVMYSEGKISNQIWADKVIYGAHFLFDNF
jgi:hypothetical protein